MESYEKKFKQWLNESPEDNNILKFLNKYNLLDNLSYENYTSQTPDTYGPGGVYEDTAEIDIDGLEDELYDEFTSMALDFLGGEGEKYIQLPPSPFDLTWPNDEEAQATFPKGRMWDKKLVIEEIGDGLYVRIDRSIELDNELWDWWDTYINGNNKLKKK